LLIKEEANMSDVLKKAEMYRSKLQSQITKIDQFLNFARELSKMGEPEATQVPIDVAANAPTAEQKPVEPTHRTRNAKAPARPHSESTPQLNGQDSLFRGACAKSDGNKRAAVGRNRAIPTE
jgi:hypothetical protein